jgi:hypothetical protein
VGAEEFSRMVLDQSHYLLSQTSPFSVTDAQTVDTDSVGTCLKNHLKSG